MQVKFFWLRLDPRYRIVLYGLRDHGVSRIFLPPIDDWSKNIFHYEH